MSTKHYYAVVKGRNGPSIYTSWEECNQNISKYTGAIFKKFKTEKQAYEYLSNYDVDIKQVTIQTAKSKAKVSRNKVEVNDTNPFDTFDKDKIENIEKIALYTDGSCSNQGTSIAQAGSGVYYSEIGIKYSTPVPGKQTNNRAELYAVIKALDFIQGFLSLKVIEIRLDSSYVMNNLRSNNKCNLDMWGELNKLLSIYKLRKCQVKWVKIKAHTGNYGNETADILAKKYAFT